ncbi:IS21 family transposase [Burkholderia sp. MSMB1589WGS]|uniref:IS21 family transposase n=1 Tax=Burkholderia sp. MSMB1589WGS TaxID=1636425 RepID=UPI000AD469DF|nr:IS21 family transposase [Burkholderia sp. MSMB1589WGS]
MNPTAPRHGTVSDFLALTDGLSICQIAEALRCCTRSVRNYLAGRSPIPWHRVEILRLRQVEIDAAQAAAQQLISEIPVESTIEPDVSAPDVTPTEILAWVGVHAPHCLSSQRRFRQYVRGWNVVDKIRHSKAKGAFAAVLAKWRVLVVDLPRSWKSWRSGGVFADTDSPAYRWRANDP